MSNKIKYANIKRNQEIEFSLLWIEKISSVSGYLAIYKSSLTNGRYDYWFSKLNSKEGAKEED